MSNTGRDKGGDKPDGPLVGQPEDLADATLNSEAQEAIGLQLRKVYGELLNAPIPDKFSELLANLARRESGGKG